MASNYPTSLDSFTNPSAGNTLDSPSHSLQHSDINDAVEALETKIGIGDSPAGSATSGQVLTAQGGGTALWATPETDGAWTSYTPTLTNLTIGNGTITSRYKQIGKTVFVQIQITFGSTTSFPGGNVKITPPVTVNSSYSDYHALGVVSLLDLGTTIYGGVIYKESTNLVIEKLNVTGSNINFAALGTTSPMTWASGDKIQTVITYEAA